MRTEKLTFKTSNRILRTYKNFPYKPWYAIAELVDNSTQSYLANRTLLDPILATEQRAFEVRIHYDIKNKTLSVWDNAMGMNHTELQRAILLAEPPDDRTGRSEFGMGMKTSCSWLGREWSIETKKLGETERYNVKVDIESFGTGGPQDDELDLVVRENQPENQHYTLIEIRDLFHEFKGNRLKKIKEYLVSMYRQDIREGNLVLKWDDQKLEPQFMMPLTITEDGVTRTWKQNVAFDVDGMPVNGYVAILAKENRGRKYAGFDLIRRGRIIVGRPGGYRPEVIFGEARNDTKNQRLYGELHMDAFPVNHLKDDFLWEAFQEEFDDKLNDACKDILAYLKTFKAKGQPVTPEAQDAADDAVADELSSDQMVQMIEFLRKANPPEPLPRDASEAEADILRSTADTYRETTSGRLRVRIYHLKKCAPERKYMTFVSSEENSVDVFINDNHPFIHRDISSEPERYETYVKGCIYDALAEWIARGIPKLDPETISYYKDQLMRGPGFESVSP